MSNFKVVPSREVRSSFTIVSFSGEVSMILLPCRVNPKPLMTIVVPLEPARGSSRSICGKKRGLTGDGWGLGGVVGVEIVGGSVGVELAVRLGVGDTICLVETK